jgi:hypothetical protein
VAAQVMRFFASTDLVAPGLVRVEEWRHLGNDAFIGRQ